MATWLTEFVDFRVTAQERAKEPRKSWKWNGNLVNPVTSKWRAGPADTKARVVWLYTCCSSSGADREYPQHMWLKPGDKRLSRRSGCPKGSSEVCMVLCCKGGLLVHVSKCCPGP